MHLPSFSAVAFFGAATVRVRDARIFVAFGDAYFVLFKCRGLEEVNDSQLGVRVAWPPWTANVELGNHGPETIRFASARAL
jgi:hypothetical protein